MEHNLRIQDRITHDTDHTIDSTHRRATSARMGGTYTTGKARLSQLARQFGMDGSEFLLRQLLLRPLDAESLLF